MQEHLNRINRSFQAHQATMKQVNRTLMTLAQAMGDKAPATAGILDGIMMTIEFSTRELESAVTPERKSDNDKANAEMVMTALTKVLGV